MTAPPSAAARGDAQRGPAGPPCAIRLRNVWKRFGGRDALAGVSLAIEPGTVFLLLGPNGAGKSTLVRILAGLATVSEGDVEIAGCALPRDGTRARARTGVILDQPLLPRDLTLREGLRWHADLFALASAAARIEELAARFSLRPRLDDPVRTFSKGMGQRAALMRALLHEPSVLLLDEPFSGLDPDGCAVLEEEIRAQRAAGRTVLLVTHDVERGRRLADRGAVLRGGRLSAPDAPARVAVGLLGPTEP